MKRHFRIAALLSGPLVSAGCDVWSDVTVPASDGSPPVAAARIVGLNDGTDLISYGGMTPVSKTTTNPHHGFVAVAAAYDPQGAAKVRMSPEIERLCVNGEIGAFQSVLLAPLSEEQAGGPGDTVENGVWTGMYVEMGDFLGGCPAGMTVASVDFIWASAAENYFGGTAHHGWARIRYVP
jgi:hypothetical protein